MQGQGVGDRASVCTLILSGINRPALWVPADVRGIGAFASSACPLFPCLSWGEGNQFKEWIFVQSDRL